MRPIAPTDLLFLLGELRERPMHVGGMQVFALPDGAGPDYVGEVHREALTTPVTNPLFRKRAHRSLATLGQWTWQQDDDLDLEYHVRHSALPQPGRVRELLALCSRLHGALLDRNRPLWEAHLVEGLEGGRFALYTKVHHAMVDGVAALRLLGDSLSEDPDERDMPPPWSSPDTRERASDGMARDPLAMLAGVARAATGGAKVTRALVGWARDAWRDEAAAFPFRAPRTMFNVPITGARRFAADSWPLARIRAAGKAAGATLNDTVLAMCAGALRAYLLEQDALPDRPLIAMVPVSLRTSDAAAGGGNAVGSILCNLATDRDDAGERLSRIVASMASGKERLSGLGPVEIMALSAVAVGGLIAAPLLRPVGGSPVHPYNLVISNVPGPRAPLYWNGARLLGSYPLSICLDGQALNITVNSYAGELAFGIIGCRRNVPHLQRLLVHLEDALTDLEKASL